MLTATFWKLRRNRSSTLKNKVHQTAYPCKEAAGIVWSYLGPKEKLPLLPNYEWMDLPPEHLYVTKSVQDCSWLQGLEGECDSSHLSFLHQSFTDDETRRRRSAIFTLPIPRRPWKAWKPTTACA